MPSLLALLLAALALVVPSPDPPFLHIGTVTPHLVKQCQTRQPSQLCEMSKLRLEGKIRAGDFTKAEVRAILR